MVLGRLKVLGVADFRILRGLARLRAMLKNLAIAVALVSAFGTTACKKSDKPAAKTEEPKPSGLAPGAPGAVGSAGAPVPSAPPVAPGVDPTGAAAAGSAAAAAPAGAEGAPVVISADKLFTEFADPKADGMALLDKYKAGATVDGTVTTTATEESGTMSVFIAAGEGKQLSLGFVDNGAAAKAKGIKKGDKVTATCKVGGVMDNMGQLIECSLK